MLQSVDDQTTSCVVRSVTHPVYMVMKSSDTRPDVIDTSISSSADVDPPDFSQLTLPDVTIDTSLTADADTSLTIPTDDSDTSLALTASSETSILTCGSEAPILTLTSNDMTLSSAGSHQPLSADDVVMNLDDIGASNIVLQYGDIVGDDGELVMAPLTDHCRYDMTTDNIYDDGSTD